MCAELKSKYFQILWLNISIKKYIVYSIKLKLNLKYDLTPFLPVLDLSLNGLKGLEIIYSRSMSLLNNLTSSVLQVQGNALIIWSMMTSLLYYVIKSEIGHPDRGFLLDIDWTED